MSFIPLLQDASQQLGGNMVMTVAPFILIIAVFYFFMIRPQNKKQKEIEQMRNSLQKGDKVVTIGGIHGTVSSVKERTVILKVDDGTKIEFDRSAVATVAGDRAIAKAEKGKIEEKHDDKADGAESSAESASSEK
ncbi:MAG: preprotein translocase subunit YajC [Treponema sp.]|nr:preprotein translocase subunit YajC [Treponema sp.]